MLGLCWGYVGVMLGLCWGYVGVMLGLCWGDIGVMLGLCWGYVGIMEHKMLFRVPCRTPSMLNRLGAWGFQSYPAPTP